MLKPIVAQETKTDTEAQPDAAADALREKQAKPGAFMNVARDDVPADMPPPRNIGPGSPRPIRSNG